jgi:cytochrome c biogenesis protein CcdA
MKRTIIFGVILASAIISRLFIFSFKHIPLTNQTGGQELLYALIGGAALAFSAPTLPLLVLYLMLLFIAVNTHSGLDAVNRIGLLPVTLFLVAFVAAFVISISGVPSVIAKAIYNWKTTINIIGGLLIGFYGLKALNESGLMKSLWFMPVSKAEKGFVAAASTLGFMAGLLLFHHLDPYYDSVFFLTGRAGAFSHHPLSVGSFGLGLSAIYLGVAYEFSPMAASMRLAKARGWLKLIFGLLTIILGFSFATGTFSSVVEVMRWTSSLVSGS